MTDQLKQSLCNQQAPVFSAGARNFARVVAIWLFDFDLDGRQRQHSAAPRQSKLLQYTPRWQLNSKAIPFKLDHVIPSGELTHDTMAVGSATKCCNVQQCTCLDADYWLLLYSEYQYSEDASVFWRDLLLVLWGVWASMLNNMLDASCRTLTSLLPTCQTWHV